LQVDANNFKFPWGGGDLAQQILKF
jgi:hypothetical protein